MSEHVDMILSGAMNMTKEEIMAAELGVRAGLSVIFEDKRYSAHKLEVKRRIALGTISSYIPWYTDDARILFFIFAYMVLEDN
jgi:hypothetical protein